MEKSMQDEKPKNTALFRFLRQPQSFSQAGDQGYLLGLRGFFTLSSFIWVFLTTFAPVCVKDAANRKGPFWQEVLRDIFSVLFWNQSLIYSFFIILSARTVGIPFLLSSSKIVVASAVLRRGLRLWFPVAVSLAVVKIFSSTIGTGYIDDFKSSTGNVSFDTPYSIPNALAYFNSVFNIFWTTSKFFEQAGNTAFPSQTLWIVNVIYAQSYTVYMTMVIIPYTRNSWRVKAYIAFIITAWWVQSWAWYTITGLLFADVVMNMNFKERSQRGIKIWRNIRCPLWVPATVLILAGLIMQYLWTVWRPQYANKELVAHTGLYYTGGLNTSPNIVEPQARDDIYLVVLGFFLLLESSDFLQKAFQNPLFLYLGRRSLSKSCTSLLPLFFPWHRIPTASHHASPLLPFLSLPSPPPPYSLTLTLPLTGWFLTQSIIIYTAGIKLHQNLTLTHNVPDSGATAVCFLVCLPTLVFFAESFYRLVDWPSCILAGVVFDWIRE